MNPLSVLRLVDNDDSILKYANSLSRLPFFHCGSLLMRAGLEAPVRICVDARIGGMATKEKEKI